ncbi:GntR family transcriptional regulator [Rhodococcus sp. T2V]|uniref:GntR family transcriptional regulator n=1 Tax=Rhodococcus sp. T2V TaxID=3034164 RepID=UPI0023E3145D|nr:GntR family transcriptional regulator [Rhodococcus sp. T2V]MDF3311084.1 GntR family transcriptional regulator [Rhodococcus sp. T2V]
MSVVGDLSGRLLEVFSLRALIEGWLVEQAIPHLTPEMIQAARTVNDRLRNEPDHTAWLELNTEFHQLLFRQSGAVAALELLDPLRRRSERYTRLWSRGDGVHRPAQSCAEHEEILSLIEAEDVEGARAASERHVWHTCEAVLEAGKMCREEGVGESRMAGSTA